MSGPCIVNVIIIFVVFVKAPTSTLAFLLFMLHGKTKNICPTQKKILWATVDVDVAYLLVEPGNDPAGGVVLVEGVGQLLPGRLQLLSQREAVQHHGVPLVLNVTI